MALPDVSRAQVSLNLEERDALVLSQLTEVHFIARRIHKRLPASVPLEDLVHSGVLGLLEATERYDSTRNVQFKTFAQFRIRGAILDSLRELDRASRRLRTKGQELIGASELLALRLGRQATEEEVAHELRLDLTALRKLASTLRSLEPVDRQTSSGKERTETRDLIESAAASSEDGPLARCLRAEMSRHLVQAMYNLSQREKQILSMYYFEQLTTREIASILDVTNPRISQIRFAALAKLRTHLAALESSDKAATTMAPVKDRSSARSQATVLVVGRAQNRRVATSQFVSGSNKSRPSPPSRLTRSSAEAGQQRCATGKLIPRT